MVSFQPPNCPMDDPMADAQGIPTNFRTFAIDNNEGDKDELEKTREEIFKRTSLGSKAQAALDSRRYMEDRQITFCEDPEVKVFLPESVLETEPHPRARCLPTSSRCSILESPFHSQLLKRHTIETGIIELEGRQLEFNNDAMVEVNLPNKDLTNRNTSYMAVVEINGKWMRIAAECRNGCIRFPCRAFQRFYIVSKPKETCMNLTKDGLDFVASNDKRVRLKFPQGAVQNTMPIMLKVIPTVEVMNWTMTVLHDMSPCVYVEHDTAFRFQKSVKVTLPLKDLKADDDDADEYVTAVLKWRGQDISILMTEPLQEDGVVTFDVDSFSGISSARYRRGAPMYALSREAKIKMGYLKVCKILTFLSKDDSNSIWVECILKENRDSVLARNEKSGLIHIPHTESKDILLTDGQKIRISVSGATQLHKNFPKKVVILQFLANLEDNHESFPIQKNLHRGNDQRDYAIIKYETVFDPREELHTVHFLHDWPLKNPLEVLGSGKTRKDAHNRRRGFTPKMGFFKEKSLYVLSSAIPISKAMQFGVELDLTSEEIERRKRDEDVIFYILRDWLQKFTGKDNEKFQRLTSALRNVKLVTLADKLRAPFKESRCIRDEDVLL